MPKYKKSPTIHATSFHRPSSSRLPTPRRLKVLTIVIVTLLLYTFYRSSSSSSDSDLGFYDKTKSALDHDHDHSAEGHDHSAHDHAKSGEDGVGGEGIGKAAKKEGAEEGDTKKMTEGLKQAAQVAKDNANAKAPKPDPPSSVIGVGSAALGEKDKSKNAAGKEKVGGVKDKGVSGKGNEKNLGVAGAGGTGRRKSDEQKVLEEETKEDHEVEMELNLILKKSPVIIFSKSYCPHSAQAKEILLEKYIILPAPYVVELDKHPLGLNLQARLATLTNRRTVPNILVNGVSIGGGDDIAELDEQKKLIEKIKEFGEKKITEVRMRAGSNREREKEKEDGGKGKKGGIVHGSDSAI